MPELLQIQSELEKIREDVDAKLRVLQRLKREQDEAARDIKIAAGVVTDKMGDVVDADRFLGFFKRPYLVLPQGKQKALVAVPKFVRDFQVGWLWKETDSFYVYQLDQYSAWLSDVPKDLGDELGLKQDVQAVVEGDQVVFQPDQKDAVRKRLRDHVTDYQDDRARVIKGHEFQVLVELIEGGCLPFRPRPVDAHDLRSPRSKIQLRSYQQPAYDEFLAHGAVGVFLPTGAGKSFVTMYALDTIKGPKLIVVPTRTLIDQ